MNETSPVAATTYPWPAFLEALPTTIFTVNGKRYQVTLHANRTDAPVRLIPSVLKKMSRLATKTFLIKRRSDKEIKSLQFTTRQKDNSFLPSGVIKIVEIEAATRVFTVEGKRYKASFYLEGSNKPIFLSTSALDEMIKRARRTFLDERARSGEIGSLQFRAQLRAHSLLPAGIIRIVETEEMACYLGRDMACVIGGFLPLKELSKIPFKQAYDTLMLKWRDDSLVEPCLQAAQSLYKADNTEQERMVITLEFLRQETNRNGFLRERADLIWLLLTAQKHGYIAGYNTHEFFPMSVRVDEGVAKALIPVQDPKKMVLNKSFLYSKEHFLSWLCHHRVDPTCLELVPIEWLQDETVQMALLPHEELLKALQDKGITLLSDSISTCFLRKIASRLEEKYSNELILEDTVYEKVESDSDDDGGYRLEPYLRKLVPKLEDAGSRFLKLSYRRQRDPEVIANTFKDHSFLFHVTRCFMFRLSREFDGDSFHKLLKVMPPFLALRHLPKDAFLLRNRAFARSLIQQDPTLIRWFEVITGSTAEEDLAIIKEAIAREGLTIVHSSFAKRNKEYAKIAVAQNRLAFFYIDKALQEDPEILKLFHA